MRIGFLGGTGIEGKGLALRFARAGVSVIIGSRSTERARAAAAQYNQEAGTTLISGKTNAEMLASSEIGASFAGTDQWSAQWGMASAST